MKNTKNCGLVGNELGQAQLNLELNFTLVLCRFGVSEFGLVALVGWI